MAQFTESGRVADAPPGNWVDRYLPARLRPFARLSRLDRPIGWWLLLFPCWWSSALAADAAGVAWPNPWHILLFLIGAIVMRGAGCTYNDIVDRDIDAQVARTRSRPLPSGQVTVRQAQVWLVVQALIGLLVLLQFNRYTIIVGAASLVLVAIYPFMKRFTNWPQLFLGFAFSWGALMGWAAAYGSLGWPPVVLYAGAILWTIGYDTIYALQDKEDDALIGVRSTARLFGVQTKPVLAIFFGGATVLFALAFYLAGVGLVAFAALALGVVHLAWQVATVDPGNAANALTRFRANRDYGWILFVGLLADAWLTAHPLVGPGGGPIAGG
jgi:4-hydroxybenzoate polyprenyltransferase